MGKTLSTILIGFTVLLLIAAASSAKSKKSTRKNADNSNSKNEFWLCSNNTWCLKGNKDNNTQEGPVFESQNDCRLSCGKYGAIWPHPTGKVSISHNRVLLDLNKVSWNIGSRSKDIIQYLKTIKRIFTDNVIKECAKSACHMPLHSKLFYVKIRINSDDLKLNINTNESYAITLRTTGLVCYADISGETIYGIRHALETLNNLITGSNNGSLLMVANAKIVDAPAFAHRGILLDSARNFMPLDVIYRTLDAMAASKLNVFHWHIVDSQSFPLDIKRVPNLQRFGAYSTQETYSRLDVSKVVKYARSRGIRVLFEIDGPAHAGNGWQWGPWMGLGNLSLCVNMLPWRKYCMQPPCGQLNPFNPNMYIIMRDIYEDILEMGTLEETIHMGGDEVDINCWNSSVEIRDSMIKNGLSLNLASYYVLWSQFHQTNWNSWMRLKQKIQPDIPSIEKVIVWSSHLTDPSYVSRLLPPDKFIIHTWVAANDALNEKLLKLGYEILISTKDAWYLDHGFWGFTTYHPWDKVYNNKLLKDKNVLGGETCMWSEYVDEHSVESRIWPRAGAAAERLWSNPRTDAKAAAPRFFRYRNRLITRGIHPEAVLPKWCELNENAC